MKGMWRSGALFVLVLVVGCVAPRLTIRPDKAPEVLPLCVQYGTKLDSATVSRLRTAVTQFVTEFNEEDHKFKLLDCSHDTSPALRVDVSATGLAGPDKQACGCLVSTAGLIAPFAMLAAKLPFIVWFAYVPRNSTAAKLSLSDDISAGSALVARGFQTFPYFGSMESQRVKHARALKVFLRQVVSEVERSIKP